MHDAPASASARAAFRSGYMYGMTTKPSFGKDFCSFDGFIIIRQQVFGVVNNFDLYKITTAEFPGETGNTHSFFGVSGTGSIWQQCDIVRNIIQNICKSAFIGPAQSQSDDLCPCFFYTGFLPAPEKIFPEPRIKREVNSCPPSINLSSIVFVFMITIPFFLLNVCVIITVTNCYGLRSSFGTRWLYIFFSQK